MCWKDTDNTEKEREGGGEGRRRYSDNTTNSVYPFLIHSLTLITQNEILQGAKDRYTRTERVR